MDAEEGLEAHLDTLCAEVDDPPESIAQPLSMPIVASAVFQVDSLEALDDISEGHAAGYLYSRDAGPNQAALERLVARFEGAEAGLACASGMGAVAAALLTDLQAGARIVAARALYGRTAGLLSGPLTALGVTTEFIDVEDWDGVEQALSRRAHAVIVETISNPLLQVPDLPRIAQLAQKAGSRLIVDNTFATPYHCRPLVYGAGIVVHSATKYLGGHSDVTCGVVVGPADFISRARTVMSTFGAPASPFDCWLTMRGIKTLALRMERASANARTVAEFLATRPDVVATVHYPGLPSQSGHGVAGRILQRGFGAMISFDLHGGEPAASAFVRGLRRIRLAPSLADVSTTISHPAKTSHRGLSEAARREAGISAGLIRLSVGIEYVDDIIADLEAGLSAAAT